MTPATALMDQIDPDVLKQRCQVARMKRGTSLNMWWQKWFYFDLTKGYVIALLLTATTWKIKLEKWQNFDEKRILFGNLASLLNITRLVYWVWVWILYLHFGTLTCIYTCEYRSHSDTQWALHKPQNRHGKSVSNITEEPL